MTIAPVTPAQKDAVCAFIFDIQTGEFGVKVTLDDQPDLLGLPASYARGASGFWTATDDDGRVIGTIGLLDAGLGLGALRKMFVAADHRGTGLAQRLLDVLLAHARQHGFTRILLGTVDQLQAAIRFYERNGFAPVPGDDLPAHFPRMAVDTTFFGLDL